MLKYLRKKFKKGKLWILEKKTKICLDPAKPVVPPAEEKQPETPPVIDSVASGTNEKEVAAQPIEKKTEAQTVAKNTTMATTAVATPNTGVQKSQDMTGAFLAAGVIIGAVILAFLLAKSKKIKSLLFASILVLSVAAFGFISKNSFADNLDGCQKIGYTDYDIVVKFVTETDRTEIDQPIVRQGSEFPADHNLAEKLRFEGGTKDPESIKLLGDKRKDGNIYINIDAKTFQVYEFVRLETPNPEDENQIFYVVVKDVPKIYEVKSTGRPAPIEPIIS